MRREVLLARMVERKVTTAMMCSALRICQSAWYNKINGISDFKSGEIRTIIRVLKLTDNDAFYIFFADDVE